MQEERIPVFVCIPSSVHKAVNTEMEPVIFRLPPGCVRIRVMDRGPFIRVSTPVNVQPFALGILYPGSALEYVRRHTACGLGHGSSRPHSLRGAASSTTAAAVTSPSTTAAMASSSAAASARICCSLIDEPEIDLYRALICQIPFAICCPDHNRSGCNIRVCCRVRMLQRFFQEGVGLVRECGS